AAEGAEAGRPGRARGPGPDDDGNSGDVVRDRASFSGVRTADARGPVGAAAKRGPFVRTRTNCTPLRRNPPDCPPAVRPLPPIIPVRLSHAFLPGSRSCG